MNQHITTKKNNSGASTLPTMIEFPSSSKLRGIAIDNFSSLRPNVERVLRHQLANPDSNIRWRWLTSLADWAQLGDLHPSIRGKSRSELALDTIGIGATYYTSLRNWSRKGSEEGKLDLPSEVDKLFPPRQRSWTHLDTIEKWIEARSSNPVWHGKSTLDFQRGLGPEGLSFYQGAANFAKRLAQGNRELRRAIMRQVFPPLRSSWQGLDTLEKWKVEFSKHPEWSDRTRTQLWQDRSPDGSARFMQALSTWASKVSKGNDIQYENLMNSIVPSDERSWTGYKSLSNWSQEHAKHPAWQGLSISTLLRSEDPEARSFAQAFLKWARAESTASSGDFSRAKYRELIGTLCPYRYTTSNDASKKNLTSDTQQILAALDG